MALFNHLLLSLIIAFLIGGFLFIMGLIVYQGSKKIVAEASAAVFIFVLFFMFIPYAQNDVTSRAVSPMQDVIVVNNRTTEKISFSLDEIENNVYVKGDCDKNTKISFYGYTSYLGPEDSVDTIIRAKNSSGVYECTLHLCKSPYCDKILSNITRKIKT